MRKIKKQLAALSSNREKAVFLEKLVKCEKITLKQYFKLLNYI